MPRMLRTVATVLACIFLLTGCGLVRTLLPRKGTTAIEAKMAMELCGIEADAIAWSVEADGTFAYGRKSANAPPIPARHNECLVQWVTDNRIKFAFIGWETSSP